ncbi:carbamoyltransferase HypF [Thiorhodococcus mannitoliphagus]|uniref:Carbamoyltransferase HypF n=1 Tax=Thiorhodococcus mannitoliphagus TaxID=329406 RepID=A0A6P1DVP9_9GAMM|nr:carbamoyltransferase HypF [Thiorhodococcus mannitoliphagus]NEX20162.1 carbamoyltransferase HypF [Thiorhodococcus mannitoliphagus]
MNAELIRVRGLVQGVGFRPTVWRLARTHALVGEVLNDGEGVLIHAQPAAGNDASALDDFCRALRAECPPLARIDAIERSVLEAPLTTDTFVIRASSASQVHTGIVPDAATCAACAAEIRDPSNRRYRYPFTNCTHCGPRLSIVKGIPYDRARTSMAVFPMCPSCGAEYADPADRRFHAQPNACAVCGPSVWLVDSQGARRDPAALEASDPIAAASQLLAAGRILAIKGIGGFHLACDATNAASVAELRRRKRRFGKPFALMARDLDVIRAYCTLDAEEAGLLQRPAAPILLLDVSPKTQATPLAPDIAPGQRALGFMLPYSPLHHLLLQAWDRPLVMTSGNLSEEPQCIDNADAADRLGTLADATLLHDREIVNRVDDSVIRRMAGAPRLLRRARGYAPAPIRLPPGFEQNPPILALGGELKNTFCLLSDGQAMLSQHLGDLEDARTARELEVTLDLYLELFQHRPEWIAVDLHPDYRSTLIGRERAAHDDLPLLSIQHHHAHLASTLADNGWAMDAGPVLGIILDGLGFGPDGTLWGGELLLGDYLDCERVGHLKPVPMPGGTKAILEPWRNLFAQLEAADGWATMRDRHPTLESLQRLGDRPLDVLRKMMARGVNAPLTSSAGRLFDAVAAALGVGGDPITYEGQAAIELEALAAQAMDPGLEGYRLKATRQASGMVLDPASLWEQLFADLEQGVSKARIAARFHSGLSQALGDLAIALAEARAVQRVALSGGVFQNRILLESVQRQLSAAGLETLLQRQVPSNDGGLSLGQACIAAARASRASE